jgi:hypothetical protein
MKVREIGPNHASHYSGCCPIFEGGKICRIRKTKWLIQDSAELFTQVVFINLSTWPMLVRKLLYILWINQCHSFTSPMMPSNSGK